MSDRERELDGEKEREKKKQQAYLEKFLDLGNPGGSTDQHNLVDVGLVHLEERKRGFFFRLFFL